MQPTQPIIFEEILSMSVQKDPEAVRQFAFKLRQHLDVQADYEASQLPVQQIAEGIKHTKRTELIKDSLTEHSSSHLT